MRTLKEYQRRLDEILVKNPDSGCSIYHLQKQELPLGILCGVVQEVEEVMNSNGLAPGATVDETMEIFKNNKQVWLDYDDRFPYKKLMKKWESFITGRYVEPSLEHIEEVEDNENDQEN